MAAAESHAGNTLPVRDLAAMAAPYNPRRISDHDLDALRRSLRFFGAVEPVVVNSRSGHIVGGHQRVMAAGLESIETFPVVYVDLDDASEKQLNLALNRISGHWDDEKLREVIIGLESDGADLELTGFEDKELAALLKVAVDGRTRPEVVPIKPPERSESGHVRHLGDHRLVCGDALNSDDWAMLGDRFDACITDPPYGVDLEYSQHDDSEAALRDLVRFVSVARERCEVVAFTNTIKHQWLYPAADWVLCWFYGGGPFISPWGFNCWTPILVYGKDPYLARGMGSYPDAVDLNVPANSPELDHPCPKPVALWEWLFKRVAPVDGMTVVDCFAGSGTSFIVGETTNRRVFGIEKDPHYCDVILKRWEDFTGQEATRAD